MFNSIFEVDVTKTIDMDFFIIFMFRLVISISLFQVYLYEYSEDFDLMDHPAHVLPTAAIQIAALSVFNSIIHNVKNGGKIK